jgi:peptidoglycan/xylan/chitin deacetylase (PgdA/CDA1 family)
VPVSRRDNLKKYARRLVSACAAGTGYCRLSEISGKGRAVRILCYHSVSTSPDDSFSVPPREFAQQMEYLTAHFTVLGMDDAFDLLREGRVVPPRAVAVTIDDGYEDAYTCAYPILAGLGIAATLFLPVGFIESGTSLRPMRKRLPHAKFLSWRQVREMSLGGMTFGSHTVDHTSLTRLSRMEIRSQLVDSKTLIEANIGQPVTGLAYPYGGVNDFNREVERQAESAGYLWAVTGLSGRNTVRTDSFEFRRTKVERGDGLAVFRRALRGAMDPWVVVDRLRGGGPWAHGG